MRTAQESPSDETYHEFKNGETYFLIGDALGEGMWRLLSGKPDRAENEKHAISP